MTKTKDEANLASDSQNKGGKGQSLILIFNWLFRVSTHDKIVGTVYEIFLRPQVHENLNRKGKRHKFMIEKKGIETNQWGSSNKKRKSDRWANQ